MATISGFMPSTYRSSEPFPSKITVERSKSLDPRAMAREHSELFPHFWQTVNTRETRPKNRLPKNRASSPARESSNSRRPATQKTLTRVHTERGKSPDECFVVDGSALFRGGLLNYRAFPGCAGREIFTEKAGFCGRRMVILWPSSI